VGDCRFGQAAKCLVEGGLEGLEASEAEGFSGDQIDFAVEAFDDAAGVGFAGLEPVENEVFVSAQGTRRTF
jgi:hypothetical protein